MEATAPNQEPVAAAARKKSVWQSTRELATTEPTIHGVVLVAALVEILSVDARATWALLMKVLATLLVFWAVHIYASTVAHLDDEYEGDTPPRVRVARAMRYAINHSWGLLLAGSIPLFALTLGALGVVDGRDAIWGTLWLAIAVLAVLGWAGVASWTRNTGPRLLGALTTATFGLALAALKALVK